MNPRSEYLRYLIDELTGLDQDLEPILPESLSRHRQIPIREWIRARSRNAALKALAYLLPAHVVLARSVNRATRERGLDWPESAITMVGRQRLRQLQDAVETVIGEQIPGDVMETGVWRGGASILALACLMSLGDESRRVILADSFVGLPPPRHVW